MEKQFLRQIVAILAVSIASVTADTENLSPHQFMTTLQIKLEKGFTKADISGFKMIVRRKDLDAMGS